MRAHPILAPCLALSLALMPALMPAAAGAEEQPPLGIGLEGFAYPFPVRFLPLTRDGDRVGLVAIGVPAAAPPSDATQDLVDVADAFLTALELFRLRQYGTFYF